MYISSKKIYISHSKKKKFCGISSNKNLSLGCNPSTLTRTSTHPIKKNFQPVQQQQEVNRPDTPLTCLTKQSKFYQKLNFYHYLKDLYIVRYHILVFAYSPLQKYFDTFRKTLFNLFLFYVFFYNTYLSNLQIFLYT